MKTLKWIILILISVLLTSFAMSNRQMVTLFLFPLPFEVDIPVFLLIFFMLIMGAILGGIVRFSCLLTRKATSSAKKDKC